MNEYGIMPRVMKNPQPIWDHGDQRWLDDYQWDPSTELGWQIREVLKQQHQPTRFEE